MNINNNLKQMNNLNNNKIIELNNYKNENLKLKEQINKLLQENKELLNANQILNKKISNDGNLKQHVDYNNIIVVTFISTDGRINHGIQCLKTDLFAEVEEKLYKIYNTFRETNNIFIVNGNIIKRFKTMSENNIKNGDKIQLQKLVFQQK